MEEENKYPATDVAYELSIETTKIAVNRYDAQDANLDKIITFVVSFNAATVAILSSQALGLKLDFQTCLFYATVALFIVSIVSAFWGKFTTAIVIPDPKKLFNEQLWKTPEIFKRDHISYLGVNFEGIAKNTERKWKAGRIALILFAIEIFTLSVWVLTKRT